MKIGVAIFILSCALALQLNTTYSQGGPGGLLAAPYPGSLRENHGEDATRKLTYYSKDPLEKVKAHYGKTLGAFEDGGNNYYSNEVVPLSEVYPILEKRGLVISEGGGDDLFAGVRLTGKQTNRSSYPVTEVFDKLQKAYMFRFMTPDVEDPGEVTKHLEDAELKQTLAHYEHLSWSYFPWGKQKQMDEELFDKYVTAPEQALLKEQQELSNKMQELTKAMKYDEAGKVGDRMMALSARQTEYKWNWDNAMKCLQEMEKNAYATTIVIDKHPRQWGLSKELGK